MIILASASPRRVELLSKYKVPFKCIPSNIIEVVDSKLTPSEVVMSLATQKATDIKKKNPNDFVIGADTVVVYNNQILGKPLDHLDAFSMLSKLSGQKHEVMTGVCLYGEEKDVFYVSSTVYFKRLSEKEILDYIATDEPFGKAGSYAIQGKGSALIDHYEGDFNNIVGLPVELIYEKIKDII